MVKKLEKREHSCSSAGHSKLV